MNTALSLYNFSSQSKLYIPITVDHLTNHSFPGLNINVCKFLSKSNFQFQDDFESSFSFAQSITAITTPHRYTIQFSFIDILFRLLKYHYSMASLTGALRYSEHMNVSTFATSLPFPFDLTQSRLFDTFKDPLPHRGFLQYLTPVAQPKPGNLISPEGEFCVLRGSGAVEPGSFMPYLMKSQCDPRRQSG